MPLIKEPTRDRKTVGQPSSDGDGSAHRRHRSCVSDTQTRPRGRGATQGPPRCHHYDDMRTYCIDDDGVSDQVAARLSQPVKVPDIAVVHGRAEFGFNCQNPSVAALNDEVDLMIASCSAKMMHSRQRPLRVRAHGLGHERLEQRAEQQPIANQLVASPT